MPFKTEWVEYGSRVLTRNGPGKIISCEETHGLVRLDKTWAESKDFYYEDRGEITLESEYTLVRIINLGSLKPILLVNAQNYPSWEECRKALEKPYASNETLLALNFESKIFESNRKVESEIPFQILETGLSVYRKPMEVKFYSSLEKAKKAWQKDVDVLSGTTGDILLYTMLDFENKKILAKAVFTTTQTVSKETYWK